MSQFFKSFIMILAAFSLLSACGVKPNNLKRPTTEKTTRPYPDTYPNYKTIKNRKEHPRIL